MFFKNLLLAFSLAVVSFAAPVTKVEATLSTVALLRNGQEAQRLNSEFKNIKAADSCTTGDSACVDGSIAQCIHNKWDTAPGKCAQSQQCFAIPSVRQDGVLLACTTEKNALAVMKTAGVSGGLANEGNSTSTSTSATSSTSASASTSISTSATRSTSTSATASATASATTSATSSKTKASSQTPSKAKTTVVSTKTITATPPPTITVTALPTDFSTVVVETTTLTGAEASRALSEIFKLGQATSKATSASASTTSINAKAETKFVSTSSPATTTAASSATTSPTISLTAASEVIASASSSSALASATSDSAKSSVITLVAEPSAAATADSSAGGY